MDWIQDPGTPSKRATEFVCTRVESWRIKTLLAKAMDNIEENRQQMVKEINLTDAEMTRIMDYNSSSRSIESLTSTEAQKLKKSFAMCQN